MLELYHCAVLLEDEHMLELYLCAASRDQHMSALHRCAACLDEQHVLKH